MMWKKILKIVGVGVLLLIGFAILYVLSEYILSRMSGTKVMESDEQNIPVFILSNGVHTDLVFPVKNAQMDWSQLFPYANTLGGERSYRYVGIGWGDKGFYLDTPEWKDLKVSTALIAAFGLGESALHVTYHPDLRESALCHRWMINTEQYRTLIQYVKTSLDIQNDQPILVKTDAQYGDSDAFYEAKRSYSMFYSCNTWTNNALKRAQMPAGIWAVFDKGILSHYRKK